MSQFRISRRPTSWPASAPPSCRSERRSRPILTSRSSGSSPTPPAAAPTRWPASWLRPWPKLGQPIVIQNRPGGATNIGAAAAAKADPDGYTVFTADNGTLVFNPALFKKLPYDPEADFRPVGLMARFPLVLAVK